ncbi:hypothetical protein AB0M05_41460 [Streptomyces violaceusniger]|uniref:hypothetical protein n=1 Tax=Streptomyces violaceusniger TaxID=68280 RepID=UPI00344688AA
MEHTDPTAGARPLSEAAQEAEFARLIAEGLSQTGPVATHYRDITPVPTTGDATPEPQPGRPPMSQTAADLSGLMIAGSVASLPIGLAVTGVLWASGQADPAVIGCICAAPTTLILALARLAKRAKETATEPPVHHHHYQGNVTHYTQHTEVTTHTRGVFSSTRNELSD